MIEAFLFYSQIVGAIVLSILAIIIFITSLYIGYMITISYITRVVSFYRLILRAEEFHGDVIEEGYKDKKIKLFLLIFIKMGPRLIFLGNNSGIEAKGYYWSPTKKYVRGKFE